jgi:virulence-associated protein VagC
MVYTCRYMPSSTKTFLNGRSTAVRIPAEFGIKPGEELVISQEPDGTVRLERAKPFAGFFTAVERMRAEGNDPARDPPLELPRMGPPRRVDLAERPSPRYVARKKRRSPR